VAKSYAKVVIIVRRSAPVQYPLVDRGYANSVELRCIVTSRNSLIHNGATTATKSERFGAEWMPPCCCRALTAASERLLATANFVEFLFYVVGRVAPVRIHCRFIAPCYAAAH
jgi:hypothetical protein